MKMPKTNAIVELESALERVKADVAEMEQQLAKLWAAQAACVAPIQIGADYYTGEYTESNLEIAPLVWYDCTVDHTLWLHGGVFASPERASEVYSALEVANKVKFAKGARGFKRGCANWMLLTYADGTVTISQFCNSMFGFADTYFDDKQAVIEALEAAGGEQAVAEAALTLNTREPNGYF